MKTMTRTIALLAALGALAPMTANAATFLNSHDQLVNKINNAYGTQFKTHAQQSDNTAGMQSARPQRAPLNG